MNFGGGGGVARKISALHVAMPLEEQGIEILKNLLLEDRFLGSPTNLFLSKTKCTRTDTEIITKISKLSKVYHE